MAKRFKWLIPILILCLLFMCLPSMGCIEGTPLHLLVYAAICGVQVTIDGQYQGELEWIEEWGACVLPFLWQEGESLLEFLIPGEKIAQLASAHGMRLTGSQASKMPDMKLTYHGAIAHGGRLELEIYHPIAATMGLSAQNDSKPPLLGSIVVETSTEPFQPHPIGYPTISYEPSTFNFTAIQGGCNPPSQILEIWNSDGGTLNWSVSDLADWLTLLPSSGSSTGDHDVVVVSVDISDRAGNVCYGANILISAAGATNSPQYVPVSLTVNPRGEDNPSAEVGLAAIQDKVVMAYGYKAGEAVDGWSVYSPEWAITHPEWNTLRTLYVGRGYWVNVSKSCNLTYASSIYELDQGWNLIGWRGWC